MAERPSHYSETDEVLVLEHHGGNSIEYIPKRRANTPPPIAKTMDAAESEVKIKETETEKEIEEANREQTMSVDDKTDAIGMYVKPFASGDTIMCTAQ